MTDPLANRVAQACAQEFGVTVEQIYGRGRWEPLVVARQIAMFLLQVDGGFKSVRAGKAFNRVHPGGRIARTNVQGWIDSNDRKITDRLARIRWALKPQWWVI